MASAYSVAEPVPETAAPAAPATGAPAQVGAASDTPSDPRPVYAEPAGTGAGPIQSAPSAADASVAPTPAPPPAQPGGRSAPPRPPWWAVTAALVAIAAIVSGTAAQACSRATTTSWRHPHGGRRRRDDGAGRTRFARGARPGSAVEGLRGREPTGRRRDRERGLLQPAALARRIPRTAGRSPSIRTHRRSLRRTRRRASGGVAATGGRCDGTFWGGSGSWVHEGTPPKPGGDRFCYFDGDDAVMVWTHKKLGQPTHRDMAVAREGSTDHAALFNWWRFGTTGSARSASSHPSASQARLWAAEAARSRCANAVPVRGRSADSFAIAPCTTSASACGTSGRTAEASGGGSSRCATRPRTSSGRRTAEPRRGTRRRRRRVRRHRSRAGLLTPDQLRRDVVERAHHPARQRQHGRRALRQPEVGDRRGSVGSSITFEGFTSRWTIPCACSASSAEALGREPTVSSTESEPWPAISVPERAAVDVGDRQVVMVPRDPHIEDGDEVPMPHLLRDAGPRETPRYTESRDSRRFST